MCQVTEPWLYTPNGFLPPRSVALYTVVCRAPGTGARPAPDPRATDGGNKDGSCPPLRGPCGTVAIAPPKLKFAPQRSIPYCQNLRFAVARGCVRRKPSLSRTAEPTRISRSHHDVYPVRSLGRRARDGVRVTVVRQAHESKSVGTCGRVLAGACVGADLRAVALPPGQAGRRRGRRRGRCGRLAAAVHRGEAAAVAVRVRHNAPLGVGSCGGEDTRTLRTRGHPGRAPQRRAAIRASTRAPCPGAADARSRTAGRPALLRLLVVVPGELFGAGFFRRRLARGEAVRRAVLLVLGPAAHSFGANALDHVPPRGGLQLRTHVGKKHA